MKKRLFTLITTLLCLASSSFAQKEAKTMAFTVKGGITYPMIYDMDRHIGFIGGIEGQYQLTKRKAVSLGLTYNDYSSTEGWSPKNYWYQKGTDVRLGYLSMPLMYNYYVVKGLALKAGVEANVCVYNATRPLGSTFWGPSGSYEKHVKYNAYHRDTAKFNKVRFAIPIGISYELNNIILDARYEYGLTDVSQQDGIHYSMIATYVTLGIKL